MMRFSRGKKQAVLIYLDSVKQAEWDAERWGDRKNVTGEEFGNNERCLRCGAPAGKQCVMADGKSRNYPHQKRRDLAFAREGKAY